ncbi:MAG: prepilin-type N-terminal cleavage/methylation domain-containing protein [Tepidisphaeraceae bacterium]|jgi:prepilin-type processing-associated H-X9-DG protein/prepilin-type N-terminal cleavage/methylation domain-containing protein
MIRPRLRPFPRTPPCLRSCVPACLFKAFTLVELLVVITIIAILMALLLPSLAMSRTQAQTIQCLSNLRQLAIATASYANTYNGQFPIAQYGSYQPPLSINFSWDFTTETNVFTGVHTVLAGILWQGSTNLQIQQCPAYDGSSSTLTDPYTGYNYNTSYIGHGQNESIPAPIKLSQVRRPSRCALFGDGQYYGGADKYMRAPFPNPGDAGFVGRSAGTQGFRHNGKTNVAFCDGHAETLPQRFTTMDPATEEPMISPKTGFLSADNSLYDPQGY